MLTHLAIQDFAIVDRLELELADGMTAVTGETGAGKSILLGALGLCLGERADAGSVRHTRERADLSATFDIQTLPAAQAWLAERDMGSDECLLRRVITASGRSKAWINGHPAAINDLRALGQMLIQVHGQHAHQTLMHDETHRALLDAAAGLEDDVQALGETFREWQSCRRRQKRLSEADHESQARCQLLRYQVEELDQLDLGVDELPALEHEQQQLAHAEEILRETRFAQDCCSHDDSGALTLLQHARQHLATLPGCEAGDLGNIMNLLDNACIQLEEASRELILLSDHTELDPDRLSWVESRLGDIHRLARKHHVAPEDLYAQHQRLSEELTRLDADDSDLDALSAHIETLRDRYRQQASAISATRRKAAGTFGRQVQQQLAFLAMDKARFEVDVSSADSPGPQGLDRVRFMISANPGQPTRPLAKVASGGELSRISLAIQVVAAQHSTVPSLVFDEVDVGVSGATAEIVGQLLRRLGDNGQVMTVTHLPQVAAQAHHHLHIEKQARRNDTLTRMAHLDEGGRISELARMLGGVNLSEQTLAHAREMLHASQSRPH